MVDKNMPTTPLNPNWHLLANLRPKLRKHVCTYPQKYRGERWYLLRDQKVDVICVLMPQLMNLLVA